MNLRTVCDILENGKRKRIRSLEDHSDLFPQSLNISVSAVDRLPVEQHLSRKAHARNGIVHTVEDAQQGRLASSGGPDDGGDGAGPAANAHRFERVNAAVKAIQ